VGGLFFFWFVSAVSAHWPFAQDRAKERKADVSTATHDRNTIAGDENCFTLTRTGIGVRMAYVFGAEKGNSC
jgi:hypothetical protein